MLLQLSSMFPRVHTRESIHILQQQQWRARRRQHADVKARRSIQSNPGPQTALRSTITYPTSTIQQEINTREHYGISSQQHRTGAAAHGSPAPNSPRTRASRADTNRPPHDRTSIRTHPLGTLIREEKPILLHTRQTREHRRADGRQAEGQRTGVCPSSHALTTTPPLCWCPFSSVVVCPVAGPVRRVRGARPLWRRGERSGRAVAGGAPGSGLGLRAFYASSQHIQYHHMETTQIILLSYSITCGRCRAGGAGTRSGPLYGRAQRKENLRRNSSTQETTFFLGGFRAWCLRRKSRPAQTPFSGGVFPCFGGLPNRAATCRLAGRDQRPGIHQNPRSLYFAIW